MDVRPFYAGDPLLEVRMPDILRCIKLYTSARTTIFTNGTCTENREMLLDQNLDELHITISAATPETYLKIHHAPLFQRAVETAHWIREKRPELNLTVHFVIVQDNYGEVEPWKILFKDFNQLVSPLALNQDTPTVRKAMGNISMEMQHEKGTLKGNLYGLPCTLWNNLTVDSQGRYLQCCTFYHPATWNYGSIHEKTVDEMWKEKMENHMRNPICLSCNMRARDWKERIASLS